MRLSDKITHDADWRDGINAFRLRTREEIEELRAELEGDDDEEDDDGGDVVIARV